MKRYKTTEAVVKALKLAAAKATEQCHDAYRVLRDHRRDAAYPGEVNYRTAFGPYKVRDGEFRTDRFWFDPTTLEARSYGWWSMLTVRNGKLIRNACGYSMQTSVHQDLLSRAMEALGIKADITVYTRANIGSLDAWKTSELESYASAVLSLKHCTAAKKASRRQWVRRAERELKRLEAYRIGLKFTAKDKREAVAKAEERRASDLRWKRERAAHRREQEAKRLAIAVNQSGGVIDSHAALRLVTGGAQ